MLVPALFAALQAVSAPATVTCPGGAQVGVQTDCPRFVFFDSAGLDIRREWTEVLDAAAARATEAPNTRLILSGHSDASGPAGANLRVSRERAEVVRDALIARGIAPGRVTVEAFGESQLLIPTADGVREPQNRRVEIRIVAAP